MKNPACAGQKWMALRLGRAQSHRPGEPRRKPAVSTEEAVRKSAELRAGLTSDSR